MAHGSTNGTQFTLTFSSSTGTLSVDISTQGVGGRDQVAAFSPGAEVFVHYIYNGGSRGLLASLSLASPTVPVGWSFNNYTPSCFILDGSGNFPPAYQAGITIYYNAPSVVLSSGSATTQTGVSVASKVPAAAEAMLLQAIHHDASGGTNTAILRTVTGQNQFLSVCSANAYTTIDFTAPNIGQNFYYLITATGTLDVYVSGYTVQFQ